MHQQQPASIKPSKPRGRLDPSSSTTLPITIAPPALPSASLPQEFAPGRIFIQIMEVFSQIFDFNCGESGIFHAAKF